MASATSQDSRPSSILCRYYMHGTCREGSRCQFSHNRDDRPSNICKYYNRGNCFYGSCCRYDHIKPPTSTNKPSVPVASPNGKRDSAVGTSSSSRHAHSSHSVAANSSGGDDVQSQNLSEKTAVKYTENAKSSSRLRAEAQEFVPYTMRLDEESLTDSYAAAVTGDCTADVMATSTASAKDVICAFNVKGQCWYGDQCSFTHGDICDLCDLPVLHPTNAEMNLKHREECLKDHQHEMETAFAIANSENKQCGICMEVVLEKSSDAARRFGILPGCKHCFCLECIRKWRQAKQFENKVIRACPECRKSSDFVAPSSVWVEGDDEKEALLETYKTAMKKKNCKYFNNGKSECPFGNKCFYRHINPDGTEAEGDSPRSVRRRLNQRRRREGAPSNMYLLWQFMEERNSSRSRNSSGRDDLLLRLLESELDLYNSTDSSSDVFEWP